MCLDSSLLKEGVICWQLPTIISFVTKTIGKMVETLLKILLQSNHTLLSCHTFTNNIFSANFTRLKNRSSTPHIVDINMYYAQFQSKVASTCAQTFSTTAVYQHYACTTSFSYTLPPVKFLCLQFFWSLHDYNPWKHEYNLDR